MRLIIVSGLSGSGKSVALAMLEDLEYYCVDNIPAGLLPGFIAYTVRTSESTYRQTAVGVDARNRPEDLAEVPRLVESLGKSGIACEMRTTVHPDLLSAESLWRVAESLARRGARHFVVQEFRAAGCMDGVLRERAASGYLVPGQLRDMARLFTTFEVRRS